MQFYNILNNTQNIAKYFLILKQLNVTFALEFPHVVDKRNYLPRGKQ